MDFQERIHFGVSHSEADVRQEMIERELEDEGHNIRGHIGYDKFTPSAILTLLGAFCIHLIIGT